MRSNKKMSKEKMVEVESGPKAARGMESPRKRSAELPDSAGLKAGIRFELRRRAKKLWIESKQLDLTSLGILG